MNNKLFDTMNASPSSSGPRFTFAPASLGSTILGLVGVLLAFTVWIPRAAGAAMRNCLIVARTGVLQDGVVFTGFEPNVSINDFGVVAFAGQTNGSTTSFETIYTGDGRTPLIPACVTPSSDRDIRPFLQINNSRSVAAIDQTVPFNRFLRIWYPPGCFTLIARERVSQFSDKLPSDSVSINNAGNGAYIRALWTDPTIPRLATFSGPEIALPTTLSAGSLNPVIADSGHVALTVEESGVTKIKLFSPDLASSEDIASTAVGWTALGRAPGVSSDGRIVAFYAEEPGGPGIFVSYPDNLGREIYRVASAADGFSSFRALNSRVTVGRSCKTIIAFMARKNNRTGIYTTLVDFRTMDEKVEGAKTNGLLVGVYHLAHPEKLNRSPIAEAESFLNYAQKYTGPGYLPPVLDLEQKFADKFIIDRGFAIPDQGFNAAAKHELSQWVRTWLDYVGRCTCSTPILYVGRAALSYLDEGIADRYPLWITTLDGDESSAPTYQAYSWPQWKFKQYAAEASKTSSGQAIGRCDGITGDVDLDSFSGSLAKLASLTNRISCPPVITSSTGVKLIKQGSGLTFQIRGNSAIPVVVQVSSDLQSWSDIGTTSLVDGKATFSDATSGHGPMRFYRIKP